MNMIECVVFSVSALIRYPLMFERPIGDHVRMTRARRAKSCRPFPSPLRKSAFFYICIYHLGAIMAAPVSFCSIDLQRRYLMADISLRISVPLRVSAVDLSFRERKIRFLSPG